MIDNLNYKTLEIFLSEMKGQECCRKHVWRGKSFSMGFGKKIYHGNEKLITPFYGEWEIGTYLSCWRIRYKNKILFGVLDGDLSLDEPICQMNKEINNFNFGKLLNIKNTSHTDIVIEIEGDIFIDIYSLSSNDDQEIFHIIHHDVKSLGFSPKSGWKTEEKFQQQ